MTSPIRQLLRHLNLEVAHYDRTTPRRRNVLLARSGATTVVDVGANVGQYGLSLRAHGFRGAIISVEPAAQPFRELVANARRHGTWIAERLAIGREPGTLTLNVSADSRFSSALALEELAVGANPHSRFTSAENVPVETLDGLLARHHLDPARTAVKLDVQGFEREVLDGGATTLQATPYVQIELTPRAVYVGQMLLPEALDRLAAAGLMLALADNVFLDRATGMALQFDGIFVRA